MCAEADFFGHADEATMQTAPMAQPKSFRGRLNRRAYGFKEYGRDLLRDPTRIPKVIQTEIRSRGMSFAGTIELLMSAGVCLSTTYVFVTELSPTFRSLSLGVLTAAELLWFGSHAAHAVPISAVEEKQGSITSVAEENRKNDFVHSAHIIVSHGFSALSGEQRKTIRNTFKTGTVLDAAASISYAVAGLMLNDLWMPASSLWFVVSDKVRLSKRQGPEVPFPHFEEDMPLRERISGYKQYVKEVYANNPNLQAESFSFPGVMVSLIGLSYVLPPEQMAVFFVGYGTASALRAASIAIQETEEEKEQASQPKDPKHFIRKRWWSPRR